MFKSKTLQFLQELESKHNSLNSKQTALLDNEQKIFENQQILMQNDLQLKKAYEHQDAVIEELMNIIDRLHADVELLKVGIPIHPTKKPTIN